MFHRYRRWAIADVADADDLAAKLTEQTWCLCQGFRLGGILFLNDSLTEDSVVEYGIVREADLQQLESITFGWCTKERARLYIEQAVAGTLPEPWPLGFGAVAAHRLEPAAGHRCARCA